MVATSNPSKLVNFKADFLSRISMYHTIFLGLAISLFISNVANVVCAHWLEADTIVLETGRSSESLVVSGRCFPVVSAGGGV